MLRWRGRTRFAACDGGAAVWLAAGLFTVLAAPSAPAAGPIEALPAARLADLEPGESTVVSDWPIDESRNADLVFTRIDVWDPVARIVVVGAGGATFEQPRPARRHLIGRAISDPAVAVVLAIDADGAIDRMIAFGPDEPREFKRARTPTAGTLDLEPVGDARLPDGTTPSWTCGQEELPTEFPEVVPALPAARALSLSSLHTATVAIDTDNEFMSLKFANNTTNAGAYIADLFAAINVMYERDLNVRLLVGNIYLRVASDPYEQTTTGSVTSAQLNEFSNYWASNYGAVTRALAAMLSGKQPTDSSASGRAWLNGLCSGNVGYSFSQVFKATWVPLVEDAKIVGHEIGHNFGSPHTHCYSPPIDNCYASEGGCYSGATSCPTPATVNGVSNVKGTIMSYCHLLGGCGASMVFHPTVEAYLDGIMASKLGNCLMPVETTYTLTVSKDGTGTGTVTSSPAGINCGSTCSASYTSGTVVTLTAAAGGGSTFAGWSGSGCAGTGTCQVTMDAAKGVTATFNLPVQYTLDVSKTGAGTGTVTSVPAAISCGATCSASFNQGAIVNLAATPTLGSAFGGWSGACAGTGTCQVTMSAARSVTATFNDVTACTTTVTDQTVTTALPPIEACHGIYAGPNVSTTTSEGHLTLRAATMVVLRNGFSIGPGAKLTVALDPSLAGT